MTYKQAKIKFFIEGILMWPFVFAGKCYGHLRKPSKKYRFFFFFPSMDIGGATRVNADITDAISGEQILVILSKKPKNNGFSSEFAKRPADILDLHKKVDNKLFHFVNFFYRGMLATWINKQHDAVILGGESLFFYKMLPHVKPHVKRIELCHLPTWLHYSIGHIDRLDLRIQSTLKLKQEIEKQYALNHLNQSYNQKLFFTDNAIDIPPYIPGNNAILQVVFVGRGAPQKRVHLIAAIAERAHQKNLPVHFSFVGDMSSVFPVENYSYCTFYGNIASAAEMQKIYAQSDVLILTSAYEGLPLVVMEMMAHGKVIVSTAVNGIPDYITQEENGLLIFSLDEASIIEDGFLHIQRLCNDSSLQKRIGISNHAKAKKLFSRDIFYDTYRQILAGK